jgi:hypothetical protein
LWFEKKRIVAIETENVFVFLGVRNGRCPDEECVAGTKKKRILGDGDVLDFF